MKWRKLGLVYRPDGSQPFARTHAMLPTPLALPHLGVVRIFITTCDAGGLSRPTYVDVLPSDPTRVVREAGRPLLELGAPGTFDESGVLATSVVRAPDGRLYMYYVGFEIGTRIRYRLLSGVATSDDDGETFRRHATTPILERTPEDLYFRGGPYVLVEDGRFRMWYVGGSEWFELNGKMMPEYRVKYVESADGFDWPAIGRVVIDITDPDEHGFGRPWVTREADGGHRMLYSVRRRSLQAYRMGCAYSADGLDWDRQDASFGLDAGPDAFDREAIMYAATLRVGDAEYCYYNGNDFGREGFAVAVRPVA